MSEQTLVGTRVYFSQLANNNGKVIAIEPSPDNLKYLEKNIEKIISEIYF